MRQGPNGRRPRGRHHGGGGSHGGSHGGPGAPGGGMNSNRPRSAASLRHQTFDSHCIDVRVRGNAWQVYEKYQSLARDASGAGDRVAAENYLQHAEHYYRIIEAINEATASEQGTRGGAPMTPPFGQQPEVPTNYYGTDGNLAQQPAPGAQQPVAATPPAPAQAEVQRIVPPQAPFFPPDDGDDNGNAMQPLVARR